MMNVPSMPYLNAQVDKVLSELDSTMTVVQEFLKDTSFPLEERWSLYLKVEKQLPIRSYVGRAIEVLTDSVYEEYFPDGRGSQWNSDIDESLYENNPDNWDDYDENEPWVRQFRAKWAKRDEWREAVLQEGQGLLIFDW